MKLGMAIAKRERTGRPMIDGWPVTNGESERVRIIFKVSIIK
jgi:hypothetical protein